MRYAGVSWIGGRGRFRGLFLDGAFATLMLFGNLAGAEPAPVGKAEFEICQACHGTCAQGTPDLKAPRLAGLEAEYVSRQLEDFRGGRRGTTPGDELGNQMAQMARVLANPDAVGRVAHFVSGLSVTAAPAAVKGDVDKGKEAFVLCASCHGEEGQGNPTLQAPRLAGMSDWYLLRQLESFRAGQRGNGAPDSPGVRMRAIATSLTDEAAVHDVVAYITTLPSEKLEAPKRCGISRP
jgi:cytochrome c oxidase subunit 2